MNPVFPEASPESQGVPSKALLDLVSALDRLDQSHAFILIRHGKKIASGAWNPYSLTLPHELFSLSKSFISCAIGLAQEEGLLSIHDKLVSFFPEYLNDDVSPEMREVTLRDVLMMGFGHDRCSFAFTDFEHGDWIREILTSPLVYKPGTHFVYNSGGSFMLASVIRKVTGQNPADYLEKRLFEPLGIMHPQWDCNNQGLNVGGWGLWLSTEDVAKFAFMLLHNGRWQGKQLVPEAYLHEATSRQIDNVCTNGTEDWKQGYGYQFWRCRHNAFRGDGASGQYALVMPDQDMVLAFHSGMRNMQQVLDAVWDHLLPAVRKSPLPENPEDERILRTRLASLQAHLPDGFVSYGTFRTGKGTYRLAPNKYGYRKLALNFGEETCTLTVDNVSLTAGFRDYAFSESTITSKIPKRTAGRAVWKDENHLMIFILCVQTTARFTFELSFCGDHVTVCRTTPILFASGLTDIVFHGHRRAL